MVKPESLQITGSFKARGAFNAVLEPRRTRTGCRRRGDPQLGKPRTGAGVRGPGRGPAGDDRGPGGSDPGKDRRASDRSVPRVVVRRVSPTTTARRSPRRSPASQGLRLIHPYDDWDVIHGAGTVGLEILEDVAAPGAVVVPIGGGGQISGIALALSVLSPETAIIGVEPEVADDAARSLRTGNAAVARIGPGHPRRGREVQVDRQPEFRGDRRRRVSSATSSRSPRTSSRTRCGWPGRG